MCDHPTSSDNPHNPHKCIYTGDARAVVWTPTPPPKVVEEKVYKNKKAKKRAEARLKAEEKNNKKKTDAILAVLAPNWLEEVWINFPTPPRNESEKRNLYDVDEGRYNR